MTDFDLVWRLEEVNFRNVGDVRFRVHRIHVTDFQSKRAPADHVSVQVLYASQKRIFSEKLRKQQDLEKKYLCHSKNHSHRLLHAKPSISISLFPSQTPIHIASNKTH